MTRILGVSASLREHSHSRQLVQRLLEQAGEFGAQTQLLDLRATPLPLFEPDAEAGEAFKRLRELTLWADAFVLATPDYHGSMSGALKNYLDHFWREFTGKLFGYVVASHEKGLTVQDQMRTAVRQCYGWSLPYGIGFHGRHDVDLASGELAPRLAERATMMARDLTVYGGLLVGQFRADLEAEPRPAGFARRFKPTW